MIFNGQILTVFGAFTSVESKTEKIIEPSGVEEGTYWDTSEQNMLSRTDCDLYSYRFNGMFGKTAKVKAVLPYGSSIIINDYGNDIYNEWYDDTAENDYEIEKEFPIISDDFELRVSCVRTDGLPQVSVISAGGGSASHTQCFDGSFEGEFVDPEIKALRYGAFAQCDGITKISLPNCEELLGNYVFYGMDEVQEISLPKLTSAPSLAATFQECPKLTTIDLRSLGGAGFGNNCFRASPALNKLILGGDEICTVTGSGVFTGTPATMSIYVPDALYDAYIAAPSWEPYVDRIKKRSVLGL